MATMILSKISRFLHEINVVSSQIEQEEKVIGSHMEEKVVGSQLMHKRKRRSQQSSSASVSGTIKDRVLRHWVPGGTVCVFVRGGHRSPGSGSSFTLFHNMVLGWGGGKCVSVRGDQRQG